MHRSIGWVAFALAAALLSDVRAWGQAEAPPPRLLLPPLGKDATIPAVYWSDFDAIVAAQAVERKQHPDPSVRERHSRFFRGLLSNFRARLDFAAMARVQAPYAVLLAEEYGAEDWRAADARREVERFTRISQATAADQALLAKADLNDPNDPGPVAEARRRVFGANHPEYANSLTREGLAARNAGDFTSALRLLRQAYAIRRDGLGDTHPLTALTLNYLGQVQFDAGDYPQALTSLRAAVATLAKVIDHRHPAYRTALNNLAVVCQRTGDHRRAEELLREALDAFARDVADDAPVRRERRSSIPILAMALAGETAWSGALNLGASFAPIPADRPEQARLLNNLARVSMAAGDWPAARAKLTEAKAIYDALAVDRNASRLYPPKEHATCLNNLGLVHIFAKEYQAAEEVLDAAMKLRERAYRGTGPGFAIGLSSLAFVRAVRGDLDAARPLLAKAVEVLEKDPGIRSVAYADAAANLALVEASGGRATEAAARLRGVIRTAAEQLASSAAVQSEREQLARLQALRGHLDAYLAVGLAAKRPAEELYEPVLMWKGSVFARQRRLRDRQAIIAGGGEAARMLQELENAARQYSAAAKFHDRFPSADSLKRMLSLEQKREELEQSLGAASPRVSEQRKLVADSVAAVRDALPADAVLIDLLEFAAPSLDPNVKPTPKLLAFVVRAKKPLVVVDLGAVAPVAEAIEQWRAGTRRNPAAAATTLRRLLWAPLVEHVRNAPVVLVSPDGVAARFSFAALPGDAADRYLIEERAIGVVPVPQELPTLLAKAGARAQPARSEELLVVGDVDFGSGSGHWSKLPGTAAEAAAVKAMFEKTHPAGAVRSLKGDAATENAVRDKAAHARWIHIASHGYFAPPRQRSGLAAGANEAAAPEVHPGVLCGLVLFGANRDPRPGEDDGVLTALEIGEIDLNGVELAVLSACETGLGATAGGEGVLGLQRGLAVAGARTTMTSLWQVSDKATEMLMVRFYRNLWEKKMGRIEALREAQLWMLNEGSTDPGLQRGAGFDGPEDAPPAKDGRLPPYYWAAFVISGDWR
jgi:CHAT domain-containing protein/tetratricopeptide (TPR) repeat protein